MERKLEFPSFYVVWVATVLELIFCFGADNTTQIGVTGVIALVSSFVFAWASTGSDDIVGMLINPVIAGMGAAILISAVVSRSPLMLCVLGPELVILLKAEGGYANGCTYEY